MNQVKETLLYLAGLESSKQTFTLAVYSTLREIYMIYHLNKLLLGQRLPINPVKIQKSRYVSNR